ncbi:hypothetical protein SDC9_127770 [bioreactor metagenome]|uniref:Uncharacterized protein n=1 Tax=bioreactor metagenome TaxID=1076179 RepID=A0A645CUC2_9ZZZZ
MYYIPLIINFIKLTRKEGRAVKGGVKSAFVVDIVVFDLYFAQYFIPRFSAFLLNIFETLAFNFF